MCNQINTVNLKNTPRVPNGGTKHPLTEVIDVPEVVTVGAEGSGFLPLVEVADFHLQLLIGLFQCTSSKSLARWLLRFYICLPPHLQPDRSCHDPTTAATKAPGAWRHEVGVRHGHTQLPWPVWKSPSAPKCKEYFLDSQKMAEALEAWVTM